MLGTDLGSVLKADFGSQVDPSPVWQEVGAGENLPLWKREEVRGMPHRQKNRPECD